MDAPLLVATVILTAAITAALLSILWLPQVRLVDRETMPPKPLPEPVPCLMKVPTAEEIMLAVPEDEPVMSLDDQLFWYRDPETGNTSLKTIKEGRKLQEQRADEERRAQEMMADAWIDGLVDVGERD